MPGPLFDREHEVTGKLLSAKVLHAVDIDNQGFNSVEQAFERK